MALLVCALGGMAEEQRCNAGGGGRGVGGSNNNTRSCKKQKQDKIPQRGLGVAELERILHDQQRSGGGGGAASAPTSALRLLPPPLMQSRQMTPAPNDEIPSPPLPTNISNLLAHPPLPPAKNLAGHDRPTGGYDCTTLLPSFSLHNDLMPGNNNPNWWYSSQQLRRTPPQHHQQQQSTASTTMSFLPSSSGVHLQMEPPSSQINHNSSGSKLTMSPWKEAEKHPRPFAFDHPSNGDSGEIPTFPKPEDTPSPFGLDHFKFDQGSAVCSTYQVDHRSSRNLLGLGPSTSTVFVDAKPKRPTMPIHSTFQASVDDVSPPLPHPGRFPQAPPFYEFLPAGPMGQEKSPDEQEEADDSIDLNLKL